MSSQAGYPPPSTPARRPPADERQAFADMYDAHAAYVFDYCHGIVGNRDRAAAATQATLIAAHSLAGHLRDYDRQRAWLMALARRECQDSPSERAVAHEPPGHARRELAEALAFIDATDDDVDDDDTTGELNLADGDKLAIVRAGLQKVSVEQREILNLVYRYGINTYELPAILGIDAASVAELLTDAEIRFTEAIRPLGQAVPAPAEPDDWTDGGGWVDDNGEWIEDNGWAEAPREWSDDATEPETGTQDPAEESGEPVTDKPADGRAGLAWLTAVPLITMPASIWRRASRAVLDPKFRSYREALRAHAGHLAADGFPVPVADPVSPSFRRLIGVSALLAGLLLAPVGLGWAGYAEFGSLAASKTTHGPAVQTSTSHSFGPPASPSPSDTSSPRAKLSASGHPRHSTSPTSHRPQPGATSSSAQGPQPTNSSPASKHSSSPSPLPSLSSPPASSSPPPSPTPTGTPASSTPSDSPAPGASPTGTPQPSSSPAASSQASGSSAPSGSPAPSSG